MKSNYLIVIGFLMYFPIWICSYIPDTKIFLDDPENLPLASIVLGVFLSGIFIMGYGIYKKLKE